LHRSALQSYSDEVSSARTKGLQKSQSVEEIVEREIQRSVLGAALEIDGQEVKVEVYAAET
jgi:hypothetical protein